ncbi:MAG: D-2-hydroxyacid dehydrogenase [Planctomycetota bacterium]
MSPTVDLIRRLVLCYPVLPRHEDQLRSTLEQLRHDPQCDLNHEVEVINAGQERIDELLPSADIFVGHAKVPVNWDRVLTAKRLRWIQSSAAGLDHCLVPGVIADESIAVSSAAGLFAPQVAEQTFCLLFGLLRRIRLFEDARDRREFVRLPTDDLRGKTVGLVGLGGNGRAIASMLAAWDVRLIATDFFPSDCPSEVDQLWPADQLRTLMATADIVILTLPLNTSTRHLINDAELAAMQSGSYLINVARGPVVDEAALVNALADGRLAGVGVDVTEVEPLPATSPLWDDPRVLITPHVGAQSARRVDDTTDLVCENLRRFFNNQPLINRVDKRLGFPHPSASWSAYQANPRHFDSP